MNAFAQSAAAGYIWCILQVTLFAASTALIYGFARRQGANRNVMLLTTSLGIVVLLTLACISPWPRWTAGLPASLEASAVPAKPLQLSHDVRDPSTTQPTTQPARTPAQMESTLLPVTAQPTPMPLSVVSVRRAANWRGLAMAAAALAAVVGIARFMIGAAFVRGCRRQSALIDDKSIVEEFAQICRTLEIRPPVELRESSTLSVPATIGWRRPVVLLPTNWRDWSADERRAVFAHELAHVALRHFPLWLIGQFAVAAHFYHPLIHWLGRRLRFEQELAADRLAATIFGSRRRYADVLARLVLAREHRSPACAGLGLFMSRTLIAQRIAQLRLPMPVKDRLLRSKSNIAFMLVIVAAIVAVGFRSTPRAVADEGRPPATVPAADKAAGDVREGNVSVTALIHVSQTPNGLTKATVDDSWKVFSRTQAVLLGSKFVLHAAITNPEIAKLPLVAAEKEPLDWLSERLTVSQIPDSEILQVRMKGPAAEREQMRQIVDAIVKTYMDEIVAADKTRHAAVRDALRQSFTTLQEEIVRKLDIQNALAEELGIAHSDGPDPETELLMREISEARKAKTDLEGKLAEVQASFMVAEQQLHDPAAFDAGESTPSSADIETLKLEIMKLRASLDAMEAEKMRDGERVKKQVQQQLDIILKSTRSPAGSGNQGQGGQARNLALFRKEFQIRAGVLQQQIGALEKSIQENYDKLNARNRRSVEIEVGQAELEQLQEIAADMNIQLERFDVEEVAPPKVRVIQWAM